MSMTLEEAIDKYIESEKINMELAEISVSAMAKSHNLDNAEKCRQMVKWMKILKDAAFEYDEAWRIMNCPTPDVTDNDRKRAVVILDTFRNSLGRLE